MLFIALFVALIAVVSATMPTPWTRELFYDPKDPMTGSDVIIAQNLMIRNSGVIASLPGYVPNGIFDQNSQIATLAFQKNAGLEASGIFNSNTASKLLDLHTNDGIKDTGFSARSLGYLYKFHILSHGNRTQETVSTLYDADNNVIMTFHSRTHGHREDCSNSACAWPDFGNGDYGLNQFTSNGNTVTGIVEIDLNSPEPDNLTYLYGPWPVNRVVRGLAGNAAFLLPNIRDGILIHTGNWTTATVDWVEGMSMPNSAGCIHAYPSEIEKIFLELTKRGVVVNPNTYGGKNYPYKPQGIAVIEMIDA